MGFYVTEEHLEDVPRAEARGNENPHRGPKRRVESGYRFYHPELGRWVNRDPILDISFKLQLPRSGTGAIDMPMELMADEYGFVGNNPISITDYLGLCPAGQVKDPECLRQCALDKGVCLSLAGAGYTVCLLACAIVPFPGNLVCLAGCTAGYGIAVAACEYAHSRCVAGCPCVCP